jgi:hypothetical protein
MRTGALLLLLVAVLGGCTKTDSTASSTEATTTTSATSTTTTTTIDTRSAAEKAMDAGMRGRAKAEELKREADAKAKEADATNE